MLARLVWRSSPLWLQALHGFSWTTFSRLSSLRRNSHDDAAFIEKQKEASKKKAVPIQTLKEHLQHQSMVFDEMAETFANGNTIPDDLVPIYKAMCEQILEPLSDNGTTRILDGACGTGNLWPYLQLDHGEIVGVDLSPNMVQAARLLAQQQGTKNITVECNDLVSYCSKSTLAAREFDLVILNACFGNFYNTTQVLEAVCNVVKLEGHIVITHPLGSAFVQQLHDSDPSTVPHTLPSSTKEWNDLCLTLPLQVQEYRDDTFYLTRLQKVRARALPNIMRFRGIVDRGYGRGGKKLGFPTANLPSRYFQDALSNVVNGVYFGWAYLEERQALYKAVVNVGLSPTFEGQENPEKIIEAHLMPDSNESIIDDFYGEPMTLQLIGFLRPEIKFPSFSDLIAQINADVKEAKVVLDCEMYQQFVSDKCLVSRKVDDGVWIGKTGGDTSASWEFQPIQDAFK